MHTISSRDESQFPVFDWRIKPTFHKQLKRNFPSAIDMWEGPCVFFLKWNGTRDVLTPKKAGFPWSGLNVGLSFTSQYEGMSEFPVETLEKALGLHLIWTGGLISRWHLERHAELNVSKGKDAWLFLKMDRNPNIRVPNIKWPLVSHLTSRRLCIVLPRLV